MKRVGQGDRGVKFVGVEPDAFAAALRTPLPAERPPIFGDGHAARRIAGIVAELVGATDAPSNAGHSETTDTEVVAR